ncbi:E3 ubiquitin-protein ligase herc1 [Globisporangium polare]
MSTLFDLERKAGLEDGEHEKEAGSTQPPASAAKAQHQQSQATQYVKLLEELMRELQSPVFPLFVPVGATSASSQASEMSVGQPASNKEGKPEELDVNMALFSPSVAAHCQLSSEQLLLWFFHFGQLLGIAWRGGVLLPLQSLSQAFWQDLVDNTTASVHRDETPRPIVLQAIRDGLFSIVPSRCVVSLLTPAQVRTRLCDPHTLTTLQHIKLNAQYDANALHHRMFWSIVESFTAVERVALLGFLSGSSVHNRWPTNLDSKLLELVLQISSDPLTLDSDTQQSHHPDACYPVIAISSSDGHSARLHLPAYSSADAMRKKLMLAMTTHCS